MCKVRASSGGGVLNLLFIPTVYAFQKALTWLERTAGDKLGTDAEKSKDPIYL